MAYRLIRVLLSLPLAAALALCVGCGHDDVPGDAPKTAYDHFVDISAIPRCTGDEEAASDYLIAFGKRLGFETYRDSMFNVLIRKKGSAGRENEPPVILQAHIDMVCRKDDGVDHDFEADPIVPVITGDWITASKRTTLGADNGGGVSMIMAVLASPGVSHPPIEALLTTVEETGMHGADYFDVSRLNGLRLINLDMIAEGVFVTSSTRVSGPVIFVPMEPAMLLRVLNFPDWPYIEDSPLRDKAVEVFREFYGKDPVMAEINVNNAAVEPVVFASKMPGADMIALGVDIEDIHNPGERMSLSSYNRVYDYLLALLSAL